MVKPVPNSASGKSTKYPNCASGTIKPLRSHLLPNAGQTVHVLSKSGPIDAVSIFPYDPTSHKHSVRAMAPPPVDDLVGHALHSFLPSAG